MLLKTKKNAIFNYSYFSILPRPIYLRFSYNIVREK